MDKGFERVDTDIRELRSEMNTRFDFERCRLEVIAASTRCSCDDVRHASTIACSGRCFGMLVDRSSSASWSPTSRRIAGDSGKGPRNGSVASAPLGMIALLREHALSRPSPCPQRVLAARWRLQDRRDGGPRGGARPARARPHRPRRDERRRRPLQGLQEARDQADRRPRGLLRRRPRRDQGAGPLRAQPPDPAGRERHRLRQPGQAHLGRLPRGLLARQGERRHGPARVPLRGGHRPHRLPAVALLPAAGRRARRTTPAPTSTT